MGGWWVLVGVCRGGLGKRQSDAAETDYVKTGFVSVLYKDKRAMK